MSFKIVFLDEYTVNGSDLAGIQKLGEYKGYHLSDKDQVVERCAGCDIAITNKAPFTAEIISKLPDLKLICVAATGMNNIDLDAAKKAGIVVKNAVDYSTDSVAEQTFAGVLALYKQILYYDRFVKEGTYSSAKKLFDFGRPTYELAGKNWGIVGLGNIGRRVAEIATVFGCNVAYTSTSGNDRPEPYQKRELSELMKWADIVSVHAPLNDKTRNLIGSKELNAMKPTGVIANVARGGIIDEKALADALNENIIAGAAIDVYSREPMPSDNPLTTIKDSYKIVMTPHSAWHTVEAMQRVIDKTAQNIKDFMEGM